MTDSLKIHDRDEIIAHVQRDYLRRVPDADVGPGTQPYLEACLIADALLPVYNAARITHDNNLLAKSTLDRLKEIGADEGIEYPEASGSSGYVTVTASSGGGTILAGAVLRDTTGRLAFKCRQTKLYVDGEEVPIASVSAGPETNLRVGTVLQWDSPPPGIGPLATVASQAGRGLEGGRNAASAAEYADIIRARRSTPEAMGNDAEIQSFVEQIGGLGIEKCFTYPAIKGAGTTFVTVTLRPATAAGSRLPTASVLAVVEADVKAKFRADDGILVGNLIGQNFALVLKIRWSSSAPGWADASPWPPTLTNDVKVTNAVTSTPTSFRLTTSDVGVTAPQVGQTIGFFNKTTASFVRKRILTVSVVVAGQTWDITCDTSNNASDTTYAPFDNQVVSPWSDSLDTTVSPVVAYAQKLGPGEQVATLLDPGERQRRSPASPAEWPSQVTNRVLEGLFKVTSILDVEVKSPTIPYDTTVGSPGVFANLLQLNDFAILQK